jgi:hypothetical protein
MTGVAVITFPREMITFAVNKNVVADLSADLDLWPASLPGVAISAAAGPAPPFAVFSSFL